MFTGIISQIAQVTEAKPSKQGMLLTVAKPKNWKIKIGDSITVNGVCSTVKKNGTSLLFEYMPETLAKSNLGNLTKNSVVNVEQSLRASDRLDGHIVQGHVDCVGTIKSIAKDGNSYSFTITIPTKQAPLIAEKGSVAVDGISLTVVNVGKNYFLVNIIPYTLEHTNLHTKKSGDTVNIETDVLAKYMQRILQH